MQVANTECASASVGVRYRFRIVVGKRKSEQAAAAIGTEKLKY